MFDESSDDLEVKKQGDWIILNELSISYFNTGIERE